MTEIDARLLEVGLHHAISDEVLSQLLGTRVKPPIEGTITQAWVENGFVMVRIDTDVVPEWLEGEEDWAIAEERYQVAEDEPTIDVVARVDEYVTLAEEADNAR